MFVHDHPDLGVSVEITHNKGAVIVNVVSAKAVGIQFNGMPVNASLRKPMAPSVVDVSGDEELEVVDRSDPRTRQTFWTPDGRQTYDGAVDLRGEQK